MEILQFKKANCKNCFKCLRECPVKAISFTDGQASIVRDDCLVCGHCLTVCPQNAKIARNDVGDVKKLIAEGGKVIASVAPTFISAFQTEGIEAFEAALKKLGFYMAEETSRGAAAVANEYHKVLLSHKNKSVITSACPTVVKLIEKYYPSLLPNLAPVVTPMTAHARLLRQEYGDISVVFIGPCLSKKDEAEHGNDVDCVITFEELQEWFRSESVDLSRFENGSKTESHETARLFPVSGGILHSLPERLPNVCYVSISGMRKCRRALDEMLKKELCGYFIEMSACEGSCINGPCVGEQGGGLLETRNRVERYMRKRNGAQFDCSSADLPDLSIRFYPDPVRRENPGQHQIEKILHEMGKNSPEQELNCGACGYPTCREKAVAVYQGRAEVTMCLPYMRERAEYISDNVLAFMPSAIVVLDSRLNIRALNSSACALFGVTDARQCSGKYIGELTDAVIFEEALVRRENILNRRTFLYRYEKYVEQSVVYVKEHDFIFGIIRDMTESQKQNEQLQKVRLDTVQTADQVIEKQMRVVQEIAMLLGETTAETKIALTKLKDTMMSSDK